MNYWIREELVLALTRSRVVKLLAFCAGLAPAIYFAASEYPWTAAPDRSEPRWVTIYVLIGLGIALGMSGIALCYVILTKNLRNRRLKIVPLLFLHLGLALSSGAFAYSLGDINPQAAAAGLMYISAVILLVIVPVFFRRRRRVYLGLVSAFSIYVATIFALYGRANTILLVLMPFALVIPAFFLLWMLFAKSDRWRQFFELPPSQKGS